MQKNLPNSSKTLIASLCEEDSKNAPALLMETLSINIMFVTIESISLLRKMQSARFDVISRQKMTRTEMTNPETSLVIESTCHPLQGKVSQTPPL